MSFMCTFLKKKTKHRIQKKKLKVSGLFPAGLVSGKFLPPMTFHRLNEEQNRQNTERHTVCGILLKLFPMSSCQSVISIEFGWIALS